MKKLILLLTITISSYSFAQNTYTVNNETLELNSEVDGTLDLLWNTFDNQFRYFIKTEDDTITELVNTKNGNIYDNAYQTILSDLTNGYGNAAFFEVDSARTMSYTTHSIVDSPNTTSAITYQVDGKQNKLVF